MFFGCLSVKSVNLGLCVLQGLDSFVTLVNVCCLILPFNFIYSLYSQLVQVGIIWDLMR